MMRSLPLAIAISASLATSAAWAGPFRLLTGVDAGLYPGATRSVAPVPGPGFPRDFNDGDRLAGTSNTGPPIVFQGVGQPMYPANYLGSLSFLFRRGSIPIPPTYRQPLMGIDFLGGPLLDLDGDLNNGVRSLVPVVVGGNPVTPVEIPGSSGHVDLSFDFAGGVVELINLDATGTNEGGTGIQAEIATILVTIAGTEADGSITGPIPNPAFDTRIGSLTAYVGTSGTLTGVYRIDGLAVELWYDSIDPNSSTAYVLGSLQHLGVFRGWLIVGDCETGVLPVLSGEGLGSTLWPLVDLSQVGNTVNTAHGLAGGTATITDGVSGDVFSAAGNGGEALTDHGGDIGAYFDTVVVPLLDPQAGAFVYLEAAGFGTNNSGDPVYTDTVSYDVVLLAEFLGPLVEGGDLNNDGTVDLDDALALAQVLLDPGALSPCEAARADVNGDGEVNGKDVQAMVDLLL